MAKTYNQPTQKRSFKTVSVPPAHSLEPRSFLAGVISLSAALSSSASLCVYDIVCGVFSVLKNVSFVIYRCCACSLAVCFGFSFSLSLHVCVYVCVCVCTCVCLFEESRLQKIIRESRSTKSTNLRKLKIFQKFPSAIMWWKHGLLGWLVHVVQVVSFWLVGWFIIWVGWL